MDKKFLGLGVVGLILAGLAIVVIGIVAWAVAAYNGMIRKQQDVENQWAQVETQYQRRFDLFANLEQVGGAALEQEQAIFDKITEARKAYAGASTSQEKLDVANQYESDISGTVVSVLALAEDNPEIKSQDTIMQIIYSIESTQNQIATEVRRYNDQVTEYNKMIKTFPTNLLAGLFGFGEDYQRYETTPEVEANPDVDLLD